MRSKKSRMKQVSGRAYAVFPTSAGWLGVKASSEGLTDIVLPRQDVQGIYDGLGVKDKGQPSHFTDFIERCQAYFEGKPVDFPDAIDISSGTPFQQRVWLAGRRIPRGKTKTDGELAAEVGRPKAARATGAALGQNPVAIVVPCHRVIASDGSLCGFGGGLKLKERMLELERIT